MNKNLFVLILEYSDIEFICEDKKIVIHHGRTHIKFYKHLEEIKEAIKNGKWLIFNCFGGDDEEMFMTGDACFILEEYLSEDFGSILRVLSSSGKIGWVRSEQLYKINTKKFKILNICDCLD